MDYIINNEEKIKIISAQIKSIETSLEWLELNPSEGLPVQGKSSTEQQKMDLIAQKNVLLQLTSSLQ